ncbi:AAA family ATPase [Desulfovibrio sp.]|uniref:McrB family protein n=1 Tax=Desulfovibrio sp. TaxID=885 RepID=UPI0025C514FA|nr:AAA family ATPase [Desulfovibrio sp.]
MYSRKDTKEIKSDATYSFSDAYGWYTSLGTTPEQAFEKVRDYVVQIATWAALGDLDSIDTYKQPLWECFKWKIAFHYQDRQQPKIVNIFKKSMLAVHLGESEKLSMGALQKATLAKMPAGMGILEYGYKVWEDWSHKNLVIWKLLHSDSSMTADELRLYRDENLAVLVRAGTDDQIEAFSNTPNGTLFFLCHGDYPVRIGQFTSGASPRTNEKEGWQRRYRVFKEAVKTELYTKNSKKWMPGAQSTFKQVGAGDLAFFEGNLLKPYFETDLAELAVWADEFNKSECEEATPTPADNGAEINKNSKPTALGFNRIYYGPPGTGKTYTLMRLLESDYGADVVSAPADGIALVDAGPAADATVQRYSIVTFHQSYGYEEFVEGLRPVLNGDGETDDVAYEIRAGVFKELCHKARQAPDLRFAMVIDEINRGNISKIFGELITLIEPDKRDPLKGNAPPLELALAYSGEKFSVPANVDIIGTMNTADRSLALLDTALRRRFEFVPLLPDVRAVKDAGELNDPPLAGLIVKTSAGDIDVRQMLMRINERIEVLYDRDHCIGHAYFTLLKKEQNEDKHFDMLAGIFRNRIMPLLEEYFFEDWRKIRLVLGDNQKNDVNARFIAESDALQDLSSLFGSDHGLESYTTKRRYTVQPAAFANPQAYIGIYKPLA